MKIIKLPLSDSAYQKALDLAAATAIPVEAYLLTEIQDMLDKRTYTPTTSKHSAENSPSLLPPGPNFRATMPDTLEQVLAVSEYVYKDKVVPVSEMYAGNLFRQAVLVVSEKRGINATTVRDKFNERRLGLPDVNLNLDVIISWFCKPEMLRDHLCRKFPNCVSTIQERFAKFLPGRFDDANDLN
ncbi:MAG TPA: hypothetical protein VGO67_04010 [Verrucomicrobiae bacterium]|jgi:hypothetical protein